MPGGVISIVDVTHTPFARLFFSVFHPEPYNDRASQWDFPPGHTMLDSNQALSWMVFFRDRQQLAHIAPRLAVEQTRCLPWFSYLLSGGVNLPSFVPKPLTPVVRAMDWILRPLDPLFAIHWHMTIRKQAPPAASEPAMRTVFPSASSMPSLAQEAAHLHQSLFRRPMDPKIAHRYEAAHCKLLPGEKPSPAVARLISRRLDIEAVELALRRRPSGAQLTRKVQILCYLVEVRQAYQHHFIATDSGRAKAAVSLVAAVFRTAWKFCKGEYLVWRHGLL